MGAEISGTGEGFLAEPREHNLIFELPIYSVFYHLSFPQSSSVAQDPLTLSWRPLMAAPADSGLTYRTIQRLRATLPNDLDIEVVRILEEEHGCRKRHMLFAIQYIHTPSPAMRASLRLLRRRLQREDPPPYYNADGSST